MVFNRFGFCLSLLLLISATVYAKTANSQFYDVQISPDGNHLGVLMDVEGKRSVVFLKTTSKEYVGGAKLPRLSEVGEFFWGNNERVIIKVHKKEAWRPQAIYYGELFAQNIDGTKAEMIYGYRNLYERKARGAGSKFKKKKRLDGSAGIIDLLTSDERNILISSTLWAEGTHPSDTKWIDHGDRLASVYKLDIYNGQINKKRIGGGPVSYSTFLTNRQGELKVAFGRDPKNQLFVIDGEDWQQVPASTFGTQITPIAVNTTGTHLLILDTKQDNQSLYQLNLSNQNYQPVLEEGANIVEVEKTKDSQEIYAVKLAGTPTQYAVLNTESIEAQVFNNLLAAFPEKALTITSKDKSNNLFVVKVSTSDTNAKYYLYNRTTNKLAVLG